MNAKPLFRAVAMLPVFLGACSLLDSANEQLNVASVKFSEGSPAVTGQTVEYSGGLSAPSLDKFQFKMVFHVKADNSKNTGKAVFGSDAIKPILNFHINSKSGTAITTPIPSFSVEGGAIQDLQFPIAIPLAAIDKATIRKIIDGAPIPYFISGTLQFDLLEGASNKGKGTASLDLASGEIETRPSGTVVGLVSGLL